MFTSSKVLDQMLRFESMWCESFLLDIRLWRVENLTWYSTLLGSKVLCREWQTQTAAPLVWSANWLCACTVRTGTKLDWGNLRLLHLCNGFARRVEERWRTCNNVWLVGGVFVSMVVETLGLWTPFALQCLSQIASRTTLHCGLYIS